MGTAHEVAEAITRRVVEDTVRSQFRRANLATIAELANQELSEDSMVDDALGIAFGVDCHTINDVETSHADDEAHFVKAKIDALMDSPSEPESSDRLLLSALKSHHIESVEELEQALGQTA